MTSCSAHDRSEDRRASGRLYPHPENGLPSGDTADMCIIEFVDFNEAYTLGVTPAAQAVEAKPKTRRSRKPAAKKADAVEGCEDRSRGQSQEGHCRAARCYEGRCCEGCQEDQRRQEDVILLDPIHTGDPLRIARMCFREGAAGAPSVARRSERSGQGEESASGGGESRRSMNSDLSYGGQIVPAEDVCCVGRR